MVEQIGLAELRLLCGKGRMCTRRIQQSPGMWAENTLQGVICPQVAFPACHLILMYIFHATVLLVLEFYGHISEKNELLCIRRSTQDNSTALKRASLGPLLPGSQLTFQYRCCNYVLQSIRLCVLGHFGVSVNKYTRPSDVIRLGG